MQRDNLDFKNMSVSKLFTKQLFPTLLGMVSSALFTVVDGIFVLVLHIHSVHGLAGGIAVLCTPDES